MHYLQEDYRPILKRGFVYDSIFTYTKLHQSLPSTSKSFTEMSGFTAFRELSDRDQNAFLSLTTETFKPSFKARANVDLLQQS